MTPFFFGDADEQLYGVHHAPSAQERAVGVVLCPPAPQEYMQAHWALRRLAILLAKEGFHALRFDYLGTGDSAGDVSRASIATWRENVRQAVRELVDLTGVRRVSLLGMRLGAAIAAEAVRPDLRLADLVLWEPVVRGRTYLADLDDVQRRKLAHTLDPPVLRDELLGFPLSPAMRRELEAIDLVAAPIDGAARAAAFFAEPSTEIDALLARERPCKVERHHVPDETGANREEKEIALLSTRVLVAMVDYLARAA